MERFLPHTVPTPLYIRALDLNLVPRKILDLAPYVLPSFYYDDGPTLYAHSVALLAAADLTPEQRDRVEQGALASAQRQASHPEQGADAYHALVPHLSPQQRTVTRTASQPILAALERYVLGRSWSAPWGTLLRFRDRWRVLSPDTYDVWLERQLETLLRFNAWLDTPAAYRERVSHLHLLTDDDRLHAIELALEGIRMVSDAHVTEDREWAFAGGRLYSNENVAAATRAAQIKALTAIAPILPTAFHAHAHALANERGYHLGDLPGSVLADPLQMGGATWYCALPDVPVPWLTPFERQKTFDALDASVRDRLIGRFVEGYVQLTEEFLSNRTQRAITGDPVAARFHRLVHEDLPVAARHLDADQSQRLLALYQQP